MTLRPALVSARVVFVDAKGLLTADGLKILSRITEAATPTSGTSQATTSGTTVDFTSIPDGVSRITISLSGVSLSGTSAPLLQIGDSGGIEATGYLGSILVATTAGNVANAVTVGFGWGTTTSANANVYNGALTLTLLDPSTNTWACTGNIGTSNAGSASVTAGSKPLSATLDRIRLTATNGTDTFDAGKVNIVYD